MEQIKPRSTLPRGKKEGGLTVKLFKGHYTRAHLPCEPLCHGAAACSDVETLPSRFYTDPLHATHGRRIQRLFQEAEASARFLPGIVKGIARHQWTSQVRVNE
ncbi:MAG: hypothetical protein ACREYE_06695 [Gammaproteobacteria bacterium]